VKLCCFERSHFELEQNKLRHKLRLLRCSTPITILPSTHFSCSVVHQSAIYVTTDLVWGQSPRPIIKVCPVGGSFLLYLCVCGRLVLTPRAWSLNLLKPAGYGMHQQVEHFNNCTLCPHCICVFCVCVRTNSDLCHLHKKKVIGFITEMKCVYSAVRAGPLYKAACAPSVQG
jgi:hypothetical protein